MKNRTNVRWLTQLAAILTAKEREIVGMVHGIEGFLAGNFINLSEVADNEPIDRLKNDGQGYCEANRV